MLFRSLTHAQNFIAAPNILKTLQQQFIKANVPPQAGSRVCRVCERFALIAAAGELATHYGITGWQDGEATQGVQQCFQAWLSHRGHTGNHERMTILTQVQAFFEAHGASRFEDLQTANDQRIIHRVGFKRINENGVKEYFVLPEMFRQEICKGLDAKLAAQILVEAKMLKPSSEGKPLTPHRIPGEGVKKCYHFVCTEPE